MRVEIPVQRDELSPLLNGMVCRGAVDELWSIDPDKQYVVVFTDKAPSDHRYSYTFRGMRSYIKLARRAFYVLISTREELWGERANPDEARDVPKSGYVWCEEV